MRPRRRATALLGALALLSVATACGGSGDGSDPVAAATPASTSTTPSPLPTATPVAQPSDDVCHDLTYDEAIAPTGDAAAVPCARSHTGETFAVGHLDTVVGGHLLAVDSARVQAAVAQTCPDRLPAWEGGTTEQQRLSMVQTVWFTPTVAQSDAGADWYRCDAVVLSGDEQLAEVSGSLRGVLDSDATRARYAMCGTDAPGTPGFTRVLCSAEHAWRAISVVDLPDGDYPGVAAAKDAGQTPCDSAGREAAADPLTYKWAYEYPTAQDWADGQTYGRCWAPG